MNTLFVYLFESTVCMSVFYVIYWFFLRRDTFFQVNRFYLLAMLLFSALFPLLPIRWMLADSSASMVVFLEPVMITPEKMAQTLQAHLQWIEMATVVYFTGVLIFFFRLGLQLIQLIRITRRFGIRNRFGQRVVFVDRGYSPFSFFNLVFINEDSVIPDSLPTVIEHERIHIRQYHTIDMILVEIVTVFQWFNPVIWLAAREMKTIHEYLADEGVLQKGISRPAYQQMILNETMGIQVNNLTNNFNVSLLKKRIAMMTKSKSKTWARSKVLLALPALLALLFLLSAQFPVAQDKPKEQTQVKTVPANPEKDVYKTVEKMPSYPGGTDAMIKFLVENIKYPETAKKNNIQGKVYVTFIIRTDGSVTDVKILKGIGSGCDEEALRVVKLMPKWNPGMEKGKVVDVIFNLPIMFALDSHKKEEPKK